MASPSEVVELRQALFDEFGAIIAEIQSNAVLGFHKVNDYPFKDFVKPGDPLLLRGSTQRRSSS